MTNKLKYLIVLMFLIFLIGCNTEHIHEFNNHKCECGMYEDLIVTFIYNDNNHKMIVKYNDGSKELISEALKNKHIDIQVLDKFNISYIKEKK